MIHERHRAVDCVDLRENTSSADHLAACCDKRLQPFARPSTNRKSLPPFQVWQVSTLQDFQHRRIVPVIYIELSQITEYTLVIGHFFTHLYIGYHKWDRKLMNHTIFFALPHIWLSETENWIFLLGLHLTCMSEAVTLFRRLLTTILNPADWGGEGGLDIFCRDDSLGVLGVVVGSYLDLKEETIFPPNWRFFNIDTGLVGLVSRKYTSLSIPWFLEINQKSIHVKRILVISWNKTNLFKIPELEIGDIRTSSFFATILKLRPDLMSLGKGFSDNAGWLLILEKGGKTDKGDR